MIRKTLLASAALALVATGAYAGPQVMISKDRLHVSVAPGQMGKAANPVQFAGGGSFNNFAKKYPNGLYFCCYGGTVSGPSSFFGAAYAQATGWVQGADADVTKLSSSVGYVSGDHSVTLTLYADSGSNSPGSALGSGTTTTSQFFGGCCGVTTVKLKKSVHLSAGKTYWVGVSTSGANFEAAPESTIDQVNPHLIAFSSDGGSTWTGAQSTLAVAAAAK